MKFAPPSMLRKTPPHGGNQDMPMNTTWGFAGLTAKLLGQPQTLPKLLVVQVVPPSCVKNSEPG